MASTKTKSRPPEKTRPVVKAKPTPGKDETP